MKIKGRILIFVLLLSLLQISCNENSVSTHSEKTLKGNGVLNTESRSISQFRYIKLTGSFEVDVEEGESDSIVVSTDQNILPHIKTIVSGDFLHVTTDVSVSPENRIKLVLKKNNIANVYIIGEAEVSLAKVNSRNFGIDINGLGSVDVSAVVDSMSIVTKGTANIMVNVDKYLSVGINGVGNISYKGNPVIVKNFSGMVNLKKID